MRIWVHRSRHFQIQATTTYRDHHGPCRPWQNNSAWQILKFKLSRRWIRSNHINHWSVFVSNLTRKWHHFYRYSWPWGVQWNETTRSQSDRSHCRCDLNSWRHSAVNSRSDQAGLMVRDPHGYCLEQNRQTWVQPWRCHFVTGRVWNWVGWSRWERSFCKDFSFKWHWIGYSWRKDCADCQ